MPRSAHDGGGVPPNEVPPREAPRWLEGSAQPCLVYVEEDPRLAYRPEWTACEGIDGCRVAAVEEDARVLVGAHHDGVGYFVHRRAHRDEVFYTLARVDGEPSYTLRLLCRYIHCALTDFTMGDGHVAFLGPRDVVYWSPLDVLDARAIDRLPTPYLVSVGADRVGFGSAYRRASDDITYVDRSGQRWIEEGPSFGREVRGAHRADDLVVWWTEHALWAQRSGGDAQLLHETPRFVRAAVSDGRAVAWSETPEQYGRECEVRAMPSAFEAAQPELLHTGSCASLVLSEGLLLVPEAERTLVLDVEGGAPRVLPLTLPWPARVLYLTREELLAIRQAPYGGPGVLLRVALD